LGKIAENCDHNIDPRSLLINVWVAAVSLMANFVMFSQPGRAPIYYYTW
jgi:hypothetical protein